MSDKVEMIRVNSSFLGSAGIDLIVLFVPGDLLEGATRLTVLAVFIGLELEDIGPFRT